MAEMNAQQQEALRKAEVLVGLANRALRIANGSKDLDIRQVGWLQARLCTKDLIGLSQQFPFIKLTQLEHFEKALSAVAEETVQLQLGDKSVGVP
jgi:hypothetical protein